MRTFCGGGNMLTLGRLVEDVPGAVVVAGGDQPIGHVTCDSREVVVGSAFICIPGFQTDGHRYVGEAIANGAVAVIYQDEAAVSSLPTEFPRVRVPDSRKAAAAIANAFYGHPSKQLVLVGVTGTNGKTTTVYLTDAIFAAMGRKTGVITTLERRIAGKALPAVRTTPDTLELQALLRQMVDAGVTHAAMEVSSHALDLDRTAGTAFDAAVFTNLSQDHLDFHGDLEAYFRSKLSLFTEYADAARPHKEMVGVANADDPCGAQIARQARCRVLTFGLSQGVDVRAVNVQVLAEGTRFEVQAAGQRAAVQTGLIGMFNVYNALGALACAFGLGLHLDAIVSALAKAGPPPGRFERVDEGQPFGVVVDYAHTPDGLRNVLTAARGLSPRRLLVVFGCGGDRDRAKRPQMARVAEELADVVIVTSDNPRSEEPQKIIAEVVMGFQAGRFCVEPDRRAAIAQAIEMCEPGDLLVIAGKGHETYQIFANETIHFDDREVAREVLRERRWGA
jgi:UDP-N-acetylmuramoyl-L-alanyl-D-glutamate--2,6-diaminopimelate ligase